MKKSIVVLIVLAVIFGAMVVTVPSPERHRQLVKEKLHYKIDESGDGRVARWLEKKSDECSGKSPSYPKLSCV